MIPMILTFALHVCSYVHREVYHHKLNVEYYIMKNIKHSKIVKLMYQLCVDIAIRVNNHNAYHGGLQWERGG